MVAVALLIAALTACVFLVRAGDAGPANWPVTWNLHNSDNGVLFQLMQDVASGIPLDWSFSPQVYVFPELPISALAFLIAGGSVYWYYLVVAVLNNTLIFLTIYAVLRMLFRAERVRDVLVRTGLAMTSLLAFPLIGTSWLVSYHLAPTYYFGVYLTVIGAPMLFLAKRRWVRVTVAVAIALSAASNPLSLVFIAPAAVLVAIALGIKRGWRRPIVGLALSMGILVVALVVRLVGFGSLQGTSPLSYVDPQVFAARLADLDPYFSGLFVDASTTVIVVGGAFLAIACLAGGVVAGWYYLRHRQLTDHLLAWVYFGLLPLAGLAGTVLLMITHHLYFWPVLVLPWVLVLMAVPRGWAPLALPVAVAGLLVISVFAGSLVNFGQTQRYFGYRSAETQCLDDNLPPDATVGYASFSDARRLSLTSLRGLRLVQVQSNGRPSNWLTNRNYVKDFPGSFFYVNPKGDEKPIDVDFLVSTFGKPDSAFGCAGGSSVFVYTDASKLDAIAEYYRTTPDRPANR